MKTKAILPIAFVCIYLILICATNSCSYNEPDQEFDNLTSDLRLLDNLVNDFLYVDELKHIDINLQSSVVDIVDSILEKRKNNYVSLNSVGDIMFHSYQLRRAYDSVSDSFDFSGVLKEVKPFISLADYSFGNLETTLAGPDTRAYTKAENIVGDYSGYPQFNAPDEVLVEIRDCGFDFLVTANNHSLDRYTSGLERTIETLDEYNFSHTGTFASNSERQAFELIEVNGIEFAIVNYTYATNGLSIENMNLINSLDMYSETGLLKLYNDVKAANESQADFVLVFLHFGYEYQSIESNRVQRNLAMEVFDLGGDIIFGSHPHVLQPIDIYFEHNGVTYDEPKLVIYSMGNFLASQRNVNKLGGDTDIGVIFGVEFKEVLPNYYKLASFNYMPTYVTWQSDRIMTLPVPLNDNDKDINVDIAESSTYTLSEWDLSRINYAMSKSPELLETYIRDEVEGGKLLKEINDYGQVTFTIIDE